MKIETRLIEEKDHLGILKIAEELPDWFDEDARKRAIPADLRHQSGFVALSEGQIVGFITLFVFEGRLNMGWMGVKPAYHRSGIGSQLLACAEEFGRKHGLNEIATYTLGDSVDYEPYELTRNFYFKKGFKVYQRNKTDNPGCPEEIKIKKKITHRDMHQTRQNTTLNFNAGSHETERSMNEEISYAKVGVDIEVTDSAKRKMANIIDVGDSRVLNQLGAFASLLEGRFDHLKHPILVFKTEEPGSKQKLAFELSQIPSVAYDLVNHLINDVLVMGAEPMYIQNCIVCGTIDPRVVTDLVANMAAACREQGCVLVGGETSVQPGVVTDSVYVLSASAIGIVDKDRIIDGSKITEGDVVLGVASNGLHTNGYTLVRRLLNQNPDLRDRDIEGTKFIELAMLPHMCYYHPVRGLFGDSTLKGLAHITGGGIQDNLNRILPLTLDAEIDLSTLQIPKIFRVIRDEGRVSDEDMLPHIQYGCRSGSGLLSGSEGTRYSALCRTRVHCVSNGKCGQRFEVSAISRK